MRIRVGANSETHSAANATNVLGGLLITVTYTISETKMI